MKVVVLMVWGTGLTKRGKRELLKSCPYLHLSTICTSNYTVNTYLHQECSLTVEHLCTCVISKVQSPTLRKKTVNAGSTILQYIYFGIKNTN